MKTLEDYIKGYPQVAIYLLLDYRSKDGSKYYLCKQPGHNNFYFMKGQEVIDKKYINGDHLEKLSVDLINHKDVKEEVRKQESFKYFVKMVKENSGDDYIL